MGVVTSLNFNDSLIDRTVAPKRPDTHFIEAANNRAILAIGPQDMEEGDQLEKQVELEAGQEYTLTLKISEIGSHEGGFGINAELISDDSTQFLTNQSVEDQHSATISVSFVSNFDDPVLRLTGMAGRGALTSAVIVDDFALACFGRGTGIATIRGVQLVENLKAGDLVETAENGFQPIRWIARRPLTAEETWVKPEFRPVLLPAGCMGKNLPHRDLLLSKAHRVELPGPIARLMSSDTERLVPANALIGRLEGVRTLNGLAALADGIEYFHLLFDQPEIVFANGLACEGSHPALRTINRVEQTTTRKPLILGAPLDDTP